MFDTILDATMYFVMLRLLNSENIPMLLPYFFSIRNTDLALRHSSQKSLPVNAATCLGAYLSSRCFTSAMAPTNALEKSSLRLPKYLGLVTHEEKPMRASWCQVWAWPTHGHWGHRGNQPVNESHFPYPPFKKLMAIIAICWKVYLLVFGLSIDSCSWSSTIDTLIIECSCLTKQPLLAG